MKAPAALACVLLTALTLAAQVPAGTIIPVRLTTSIDTRKSKPGDPIKARVMQDVALPSGKVHAGARLFGELLAVQSTTVTWRFNRLVQRDESIPLRTNLRALASPMEIHDAQLPTNAAGGDRGSSDADWNTVQVGGDVVYGRRGGPVMHGSQVVGHSLFRDGVLARPHTQRDASCRGAMGTNTPQAFWLFSASACGIYGYPDIWIAHAGRSEPIGTTQVASHGSIKIPSGAGLLLRVTEQ